MPNACAKGCATRAHITACLCTAECPDHPNHCRGCQPKPAAVGRYCQVCADKFRDALHSIPELVVQVAQLPGAHLNHRQGAGDLSRRATKVDQQSPSPAWDLADEAILWAASWAWVVAGRKGYDPARYSNAGIPMRDLTTSISHITNRLTQALSETYHADLYPEALNLARRLTFAAGADRLTHRIKEPCPICDHRTLIRDDGSAQVECRNRDCDGSWPEDQYARLARILAS